MMHQGEAILGHGKKLYADKNIGFAISEELCELPGGISTELREKIAEFLESRLPVILVFVQAEDENMKPRLPTRDELKNVPPSRVLSALVDALD